MTTPPEQQCTCHTCIRNNNLRDATGIFPLNLTRMIVCEKCGDKRCPHADDHRLECHKPEQPNAEPVPHVAYSNCRSAGVCQYTPCECAPAGAAPDPQGKHRLCPHEDGGCQFGEDETCEKLAALNKQESKGAIMGNKSRGIYNKFIVERTDGKSSPGEKHHGCEYFVLDIDHDPHAIPALKAYADSCDAEYPLLAKDIRARYIPALSQADPQECEHEWVTAPQVSDVRVCHKCGQQSIPGTDENWDNRKLGASERHVRVASADTEKTVRAAFKADPQEATPRTDKWQDEDWEFCGNSPSNDYQRAMLAYGRCRLLERETAALRRQLAAEVEARRVAEDEIKAIVDYIMGYWPQGFCYVNPLQALSVLAAEMQRTQQRAEQAEAKAMEIGEKYYDLIMQVGNKYPDESRHDTAKRYIRSAENRTVNSAQAAITERGEG